MVNKTKGFGCTTFSIKNQIVFGRNFDFMIDYGHIIVNKVFDSLDMLRGVPKEIREISSNYPDSSVFNEKKADNIV